MKTEKAKLTELLAKVKEAESAAFSQAVSFDKRRADLESRWEEGRVDAFCTVGSWIKELLTDKG